MLIFNKNILIFVDRVARYCWNNPPGWIICTYAPDTVSLIYMLTIQPAAVDLRSLVRYSRKFLLLIPYGIDKMPEEVVVVISDVSWQRDGTRR